MNINEALHIERIHGVDTKPTAAAPQSDFQSVLDQLRALSADRASVPAGGAGDAADFTKAMRRADADYVTLMDLRRMLEDAYRSHQP